MQRDIKNKTISYGIVALLLACLLTATVYNFGVQPITPSNGDLPSDNDNSSVPNTPTQPETPSQPTVPVVLSELNTFSSLEEMETFLNDNLEKANQLYTYNLPFLSQDIATFGGTRGEEVAPATDYSTTNVQVEGVDEADIVKSDGEYLYIVSGTAVYIVKAYPTDQAEVVSKIELDMSGAQIYVNENRLAVLASGYTAIYAGLRGEMYAPYYDNQMFVKVYDTTDKANPVLSRTVNLNGTLSGSRMIGDYVYVVANQIIAQAGTNGTVEVVLPTIAGNYTVEIPATRIRYIECPDISYRLTNIIAINIMDDSQAPTYEPFLTGYSSEMYVSLDNMYLVVPNTKWFYPLENGTTEPKEETLIYRIALDQENVTAMSEGSVSGYVNDQFSMDENGDYFRIATTTNNWWSGEGPTNNLYVMDMNLTIIGSLEDLAPGETIYSARFMGNRCYIVTFKNIDPLFVIDLTDPTAPTVLGSLKVTGYSGYLHPYDENHIIGIGKETEAAAIREDFAWYQGVKISLFDVTNVSNPVQVANITIGDRGTTSPILDDHKALLFNRERNLLVIPILEAQIDPSDYPARQYPNGVPDWAYGDYVGQGAYVFSISPDGIELRGIITHIEDGADLANNYWNYSDYFVERAFYIEDVLYTVSGKLVKMNDLGSLDLIGTIELS